MDSRDRQVLNKILDHVDRIMKYTHGCESFEDFKSNKMCVEACIFNLMQLGELAKIGLSDDVKAEIKSVQWNKLYGIESRIMDDIEGADREAIWNIAREKMPILKTKIKSALEK
ncbi:MAG: DUF86 domain-containing protein [Eubacterium sp.]|nr:DUF86 domain-containing protein [Eubacterium sp.]